MVKSSLAVVAFSTFMSQAWATGSMSPRSQTSLPNSVQYHRALGEAAKSYLQGRSSSRLMRLASLDQARDAAAQLSIREEVVGSLPARRDKADLKSNASLETAKSLVELLGKGSALRAAEDIRNDASARASSIKKAGLSREVPAAEDRARAAEINYSLIRKLVRDAN